MLLFKGAGVDVDMQQVWERYSGITTEFMYDVAVHGNVLMRVDFRSGLFGPKIKLSVGWNVETGEKGFVCSLGLDDSQLAREAIQVGGNHKALLRVIHIAAGEYNLSDAELNDGLRRAASKGEIPFYLTRVPLTRGLQVLDKNGNPSTLEALLQFLTQSSGFYKNN